MEGPCQYFELVAIDEAFLVGDFFYTADFEASPSFDNLYELAGLVHALEGARVQPGTAAAHSLDFQLAAPQVFFVHGGNLQLAASARLDILSNFYDIVVIEI